MTNESVIIVGYCQSILMNLTFILKKTGGRPPQVTMGATPMIVILKPYTCTTF